MTAPAGPTLPAPGTVAYRTAADALATLRQLAAGVPALPDAAYQRRRTTTELVLHCAATDAGRDDHVDVAEIRRWHQAPPRRWLDVGYHLVIRRSGVLQTGRPLWAVGAHVEGLNRTSVGVCLVGGGKDREVDDFTAPQWAMLRVVVRLLSVVYAGARVLGHRDVPGVGKWCPSFDTRDWLAREGLRALWRPGA